MIPIRHTGLTLALMLGACGAQAEEIGGERYRIPSENLLMNTFAGEYVRFVYGGTVPEGQNEIGLVFTGREVAAAIPGFKSRTQGYPGLVDAGPSVVVSLADEASNFDDMLAQNVARLDASQEFAPFGNSGFYRPIGDDSMFQLALETGAGIATTCCRPAAERPRRWRGAAITVARFACVARISSSVFT